MAKISSTILRNFEIAKAARDLSDAPRAGLKMGAVLFSGSRLLSIGKNSYFKSNTNSTTPKFNRNTHAEVSALIKRRHHEDQHLTMFIYRETANGKIGNSRPCTNCQLLMKDAGVTKVWFYDDNGQICSMKL